MREANNIVDIIGEFTQLKRVGHRLTGLCPFPDHNEKTPSFSVSEDKQLYYCFGCKKAGNIYTFLQGIRGFTFPEAVEYLAHRSGIEIPKPKDLPPTAKAQTKVTHDAKKIMWKLNRFAAVFYHKKLKSLSADHPVRAYVKQRGLSEDIVDLFHLGYAPDGWSELADYLEQQKAPVTVAEQLGLVRQRTKGKNGHYDLFRNRLMFPIQSPMGEFIAFGGRALGDDNPKYLNSPESEVFNKSHVFYGLNETAKFIRTEDLAVVVEGYMDLLALFSTGIKNVVAPLGTAFTSGHAKLIKRYTKNVLVFFDGDQAGQEAAHRALPILLAEGLIPRTLVLSDKQDPDDYVKQVGADALGQEIKAAPELFNVVLEHILENYRGASGDKVAVLDQIGPIIQVIPDRRLRDLYVTEVASRLTVAPEWVARSIFSSAPTPRPASTEKVGVTQKAAQGVKNDEALIPLSGAPKAEVFLVNIALKDEERLKELLASDLADQFSSQGLKQVVGRIREAYGQMPSDFAKLSPCLVNFVDSPGVISQYLAEPLASMEAEGLKKVFADCSRQVRERYLRFKSRELSARLKASNPSEQMERLEQIMNIHRDRRTLQKD
ncbi:MAG: DNA primase [Bdellovibrionales bacterium]|nr:DNA primase [Bdellovibrionales bacterium]